MKWVIIASLILASSVVHAGNMNDLIDLYTRPKDPANSKSTRVLKSYNPNKKSLRDVGGTSSVTMLKYHNEGQFWVITTDKGDVISQSIPHRAGKFVPVETVVDGIAWQSGITRYDPGKEQGPFFEWVKTVDQEYTEDDFVCKLDMSIYRVELNGEEFDEMSPFGWLQCKAWRDQIGITPGFAKQGVRNPMNSPDWNPMTYPSWQQ